MVQGEERPRHSSTCGGCPLCSSDRRHLEPAAWIEDAYGSRGSRVASSVVREVKSRARLEATKPEAQGVGPSAQSHVSSRLLAQPFPRELARPSSPAGATEKRMAETQGMAETSFWAVHTHGLNAPASRPLDPLELAEVIAACARIGSPEQTAPSQQTSER